MKYLLILLISITTMNTQIIFDFNKNADIQDWRIVDDIVMGGRSLGRFALSPEGFGLFEGHISLDNNGGFSSVRYQFNKINVDANSHMRVKLKGDGKDYQVRIKDKTNHYYSFIMPFATFGKWQDLDIPLKEMYPTFRGRKLDMSNFSSDGIEEIAFLIGNKKQEDFKLLIDKIELK